MSLHLDFNWTQQFNTSEYSFKDEQCWNTPQKQVTDTMSNQTGSVCTTSTCEYNNAASSCLNEALPCSQSEGCFLCCCMGKWLQQLPPHTMLKASKFPTGNRWHSLYLCSYHNMVFSYVYCFFLPKKLQLYASIYHQ